MEDTPLVIGRCRDVLAGYFILVALDIVYAAGGRFPDSTESVDRCCLSRIPAAYKILVSLLVVLARRYLAFQYAVFIIDSCRDITSGYHRLIAPDVRYAACDRFPDSAVSVYKGRLGRIPAANKVLVALLVVISCSHLIR